MASPRQVVLDRFQVFNTTFEASCNYMYLDVKGLVTTGVGDLIDPIPEALSLPWQLPDGTAAGQSDIASAWRTVKSAQALARLGGAHFAGLTKLRLTPQGVADLVAQRRDANWSYLLGRFPGALGWPADAQLGVLSIAWAAGPGWAAPHFDAYAKVADFAGMAKEGWLDEDAGGVHNGGLHPRNVANRVLFGNAHAVVTGGLDLDTLYYPRAL